jgi:hypothetical protein
MEPDGDPVLWNDVLKRAIEIAYESSPADPIRESCGPLLEWEEILASAEPEKEFQRQLAEILCDDLKAFKEWTKSPQSAGELQDHEGNLVAAFERDGLEAISRGDLYPLSDGAWQRPLWAVTRLLESGLLDECDWILIPEA